MVKYIRATFLWLAGLTLISHTVIPHHHDHQEEGERHFCLKEHAGEDSKNSSFPFYDHDSRGQQSNAECIISHDEINIPVNDFISFYIPTSGFLETLLVPSVTLTDLPFREDHSEFSGTGLPPRSPPLA